MNTERIRALIEAHGAVTARWPEVERDAARMWLDTHPDDDTARMLAEARGLDEWLDASTEPYDAAVSTRILAAIERESEPVGRARTVGWIGFIRRHLAHGFALAAIAAVGILTGHLGAPFWRDGGAVSGANAELDGVVVDHLFDLHGDADA